MNVLFLCVANSARSQMAEGLAKKTWGPNVTVRSAGSAPSHVHPVAIRAMQEVGIDLTSHTSKGLDDLDPDFVAQLDYVITLCAEQSCPHLASHAKHLAWGLPDPAGMPGDESTQLKRFRATREALAAKIQQFDPAKEQAPRLPG